MPQPLPLHIRLEHAGQARGEWEEVPTPGPQPSERLRLEPGGSGHFLLALARHRCAAYRYIALITGVDPEVGRFPLAPPATSAPWLLPK